MAARPYDYLNDDAPDPEESEPLVREPSRSASPPSSPGPARPRPPAAALAAGPPPAAAPAAVPPPSAWDVRQMMWLAGGSGLSAVVARHDAAMPAEGLPVASERAGGESRRAGLKRKASEITRSAAEDFALLTTRTTSARAAADFLSTVANVRYISLKGLKIPNLL